MTIKSFAEFLDENFVSGMATNTTPMQTLSRKNLPQIINFDEFKKDLLKSGYELRQEVVDSDTLIPTQNEFNNDKIDKLIKLSNSNKPIYPCIVSNDNYIVDGHHRWKAMQTSKNNTPINRVSVSYQKLLDLIKDKNYIEYKTVNESEKN